MSLRLRLSLVIAVIAALVAAGIGFAVYDRAEEERLDTARRSAADDVRARQSVAGVITAGEGQLPDTFVEGAPRGSGYNGGTRALGRRIPPELRERVQANPGRVFTVVLREQPNPVIIAGTQLSSAFASTPSGASPRTRRRSATCGARSSRSSSARPSWARASVPSWRP
jgi:hypothetical protein